MGNRNTEYNFILFYGTTSALNFFLLIIHPVLNSGLSTDVALRPLCSINVHLLQSLSWLNWQLVFTEVCCWLLPFGTKTLLLRVLDRIGWLNWTRTAYKERLLTYKYTWRKVIGDEKCLSCHVTLRGKEMFNQSQMVKTIYIIIYRS